MHISHPKRDGHNWGNPALNPAGFAYTIIITVYTGLLLYGIGLLWFHRRKPAIRMRGFGITTAAILALHIYVAALFIVYPLNGWFKCGTEFWYMSVFLPLSMAIFQASNVRLLYYAKLQQDLLLKPLWGEKQAAFGFHPTTFTIWFKKLNTVRKTYVGICFGLLIQLITTLFLFFGSKRFMPSTGFFGTAVNPSECRRGVEWIPSVFWQFGWVWIFGPLIYFKTRHIKDTHYWGWQTRLAIIAGLPGTPLWLIFLYSNNSQLSDMSAWFPPAMWFAPGLMVMQITSIFMPLYDAYRHRAPKRPLSAVSKASTTRSFASSDTQNSKDLMNLAALEFQLANNIDPLLNFAGNREFSAENIIFLREVRHFKTDWRRRTACGPDGGLQPGPAEKREMFEHAARIFFELIDPGTAKQPINIDSRIYFGLGRTFQGLSYTPPPAAETPEHSLKKVRSNVTSEIAPWASPNASVEEIGMHYLQNLSFPNIADTDPDIIAHEVKERSPSGMLLIPPPIFTAPISDEKDFFNVEVQHTRNGSPIDRTTPIITSNVSATAAFYKTPLEVPAGFDSTVFDEAEKSVKYLVYTNTWSKFVMHADGESIASSGGGRASVNGSFTMAGIGIAEMQNGADLTHTRCKACQQAARKAMPKPAKTGLRALGA